MVIDCRRGVRAGLNGLIHNALYGLWRYFRGFRRLGIGSLLAGTEGVAASGALSCLVIISLGIDLCAFIRSGQVMPHYLFACDRLIRWFNYILSLAICSTF
jgi:hypothetical protein